MKKRILSFMLAALLMCFVVAPVSAEEPGTLLSATGAIGNANEDRIEVSVPGGTTLGDITSIAWSEYLLEGYPPHVDIIFEGDALVFEYAYNDASHYAENGGLMPFGAVTGAWFKTFSDDGAGPAAVTDTSFAWLSSGAPGPYPDGAGFIGGTLADWKAGTVDGSVDASTPVLRLEIEVDNWVVDCQALVDGIEVILGKEAIDLEVTILSVPDIIAISVSPTSIDFGDLNPGATSALAPITISNVGSVPVNVVTLVDGDFFMDNLWLNEVLATAYVTSIAAKVQVVPNAKLIVPSAYPAGTLTGTLTFEATASP